MADFSTINGVTYSSASVETRIGPLLIPFLEFSYENKAERGEHKPIGSDSATEVTRARRTSSGSFKLTRSHFERLTDYLISIGNGEGYLNVPFTVNVSISEPNRPRIKDVVEVWGINGDSESYSGDSNDPLATTCELHVKNVLKNGKKAT